MITTLHRWVVTTGCICTGDCEHTVIFRLGEHLECISTNSLVSRSVCASLRSSVVIFSVRGYECSHNCSFLFGILRKNVADDMFFGAPEHRVAWGETDERKKVKMFYQCDGKLYIGIYFVVCRRIADL